MGDKHWSSKLQNKLQFCSLREFQLVKMRCAAAHFDEFWKLVGYDQSCALLRWVQMVVYAGVQDVVEVMRKLESRGIQCMVRLNSGIIQLTMEKNE